MRIDYHDLHEAQFEELAVAVCKFILGSATQKFSKGPDGGRDGRFNGTAKDYPNNTTPHSGKFIIQAKHTDNPIGKLSDPDFYSPKNNSCVIIEELERIKKLVYDGELEHYLLFTNRRHSANKSIEIEQLFLDAGCTTAMIIGIENLDSYLKMYPKILEFAGIDKFDNPIRVNPDDLADIILSLKDEISKSTSNSSFDFNRTDFDRKCNLNGIVDETKTFIIENYLREFHKVDDFIENPLNDELKELYFDTADEFHIEILEQLNKNKSIESTLNHLISRLFYRDGDLKSNKRLTRVVVYYMFWNCDIGIKDD